MTNMNSHPIKGISSLHHTLTFFLILGLVVFFAINNISWCVKYTFPLPELYDQAFFLNLSVIYLRAWENGGLISLVNSVLHSSPYHVPLFPLTTLPFYLIGGLSKNSAYLTNSIYMLIMLISTYLIGEKLFRPKAGLLAVFMLATFTVFIEYSRDYLFEFPMTAMFTWSMFCLIKTKWLQNRKWSVLFGISMGLTLLIKTVAGTYFVGPLLWVVFKTFSFKERLKNKAINFLLSFGTCAIIAGVYYLPNLKTILWYLFHTGFGKGSIDCYGAGKISFFSVSNLLLYPISTIDLSASYPFLLFPIIILIILISSLTNRRFFNYIFEDKTLLWVWILSGYFFITLSPCKGLPRYVIPLIPAIVVLMCGLVINIPYKSLKVMALLVIFIGGMINYIALTYGIKILPSVYILGDTLLFSQKSLGSLNVSNLSIEFLPKLTNDPDGMSKVEYYRNLPEKPISNNNWKIYEILHKIKVDAEGSIDNPKIAIVPNHFFFNANIFRYKAAILNLKYQITDISREDYALQLEFVDYVIAKTGFPGPDFANNDSNNQILDYLDSLSSGFEKMPRDFVLPDLSRAIVFKRKATGLSVKAPHFFLRNLKNAIIEKPKVKYVTIAPSIFAINSSTRVVLFQHPQSKITYKLTIPENSSLTFGIALNPEVWSADKGDGVIFEILIKDGKEERKLFSKYIDPKNKIEDRKWHNEVVDLSKYGGKEVNLSFVTTPGPNNNTNFDWAGWGDPELIPNTDSSKK